MQYPARLFLRKWETKGPRCFHKCCKRARNLPVFERQAVDSSTLLSQAPSVADSGAKWEILAGFDTLYSI